VDWPDCLVEPEGGACGGPSIDRGSCPRHASTHPARESSDRSGVFNRLNWEHLRPAAHDGLIDSNASPILFWNPGACTRTAIAASSIGSQADSIAAVSDDYARWVNRVMNWVKRRGTKVWGPEAASIRPDLDIRLSTVSTVFALPGALQALESGYQGYGQ